MSPSLVSTCLYCIFQLAAKTGRTFCFATRCGFFRSKKRQSNHDLLSESWKDSVRILPHQEASSKLMIISHSSYNRELLKWQRGWHVWQDDCWPIDILDECPVNFQPINFNIICAIYSNLVWLYFNEDKLPKMIGNSDWYIRIYPPDICPPRNLVDDHGCLPHWSPHSRRFSFNLHSVGAWWRPRWLQLLNGSCFFLIGCLSPLKISEILSLINQKGNVETSSQTSQSQVPPWKLTWSLKIASLKNENCLLPS